MSKRFPKSPLIALPILALLLLAPAAAAAADVQEAAWNGGHLTATADADFTEATIESVSVSFEECGTAAEEAICTWEAKATLISHPESRCNPSTPEEQVIWSSGEQAGNTTVTDGSKSFSLEGCRGQTVVFEIRFHKTYEEGGSSPLRVTGGSSLWPLFTFGYPLTEEADRAIPTEHTSSYQMPPFEPNVAPPQLIVASDCRTLAIGNVRYAFSFAGIGCPKATDLAKMRQLSHRAPAGYYCRNLKNGRGVLCWRQGHPQKYVEWRLPGTRPAHA